MSCFARTRFPFVLFGALLIAAAVRAQVRPYIGYVYPAGGQQGTAFQVKLGGQGLEDVNQVFVTGPGVSAKVVEYNRVLGAQETTLLREQLKELTQEARETGSAMMSSGANMMASEGGAMMMAGNGGKEPGSPGGDRANPDNLKTRIERRLDESVPRPASAALANIVYVEVTIAPDAPPGQREFRLATPRGISNPLVFCVGQLPEYSRKAMVTAPLQVLGKEAQALRKRPENEVEQHIAIPCTVNGQVASGELNRYRFTARKGQNLVFTTLARQLIPFIADAVPGWFQPVLVVYDSDGKEVAYDDDFRFKPDPTVFYPVPQDGEYTFVIYDAIYRGREDFVYRVTVGEIPFVTSVFPLGCRVGETPALTARGWNLNGCTLAAPDTTLPEQAKPICLTKGQELSNPVPFAIDILPEALEQEPNDTVAAAQPVSLPVIVNGRIGTPGDWDVFRFTGKSNQTIVAKISARRLDSPLDSIIKLTDASGRLIAFNDDYADPCAGINTHDADSYLKVRLPANGEYCVHVGDTAHKGGEEYGYRLRLSEVEPDFALRIIPSSLAVRQKGTAPIAIHLMRQDGFDGPVKLSLKDPPEAISAAPVSISGTQTVARLTLKTTLKATPEPFNLRIVGTAMINGREVTHDAVPAEDRMQAFLWRHLVPASEFKVLVYDPGYKALSKRTPPPRPEVPIAVTNVVAMGATNSAAGTTNTIAKPKFTKQQVAGRLRQLRLLYEEGLLTDTFYDEKVAECEAVQ